MCGIIGFVGRDQAAPVLLDGLARMEYRGYDSAGIAVRSEEKGLQVRKTKGRLQVLSDMVHGGADVEGTLGIGHTRWATHGEPNDANAHPHVSEAAPSPWSTTASLKTIWRSRTFSWATG